MEWLWREKPDGTRGPAYPVYVAGVLAALVLIELIHRRLAPPAAASAPRARGADVAGITRAASGVVPVAPPAVPAPAGTASFRLGPRPPGAAAPRNAPVVRSAHEFDPIRDALHPDGGRAGAGRAKSDYEPLPPAFAGEASGGKPELLGYRDPAADGPAGAPQAPPAPAPPWLARGSLVPVCLLTTVDTSNPAAVIQLAVGRDVWAHGRCRLRLGTHLLGKLSGRPVRDRLTLAVDTVLYPDGTQRPISATTVEADESGSELRPGLAAEFVPPPAWATAAPYASEFATGFLGLLQSRAQQPFALSLGGIGVQGATVADDARGPAYQASGQAINDFTRERLREVEDRYAAYYLIPAGTAAWMQLEADFAGGQ